MIFQKCEEVKIIDFQITGYGQTGDLAKIAGHDINYVALSGNNKEGIICKSTY